VLKFNSWVYHHTCGSCNHTRDCQCHTHTCQYHTHTCQNHTLRVEITLLLVEVTVVITFVRWKITLRVEIALCVYKSHSSVFCIHSTTSTLTNRNIWVRISCKTDFDDLWYSIDPKSNIQCLIMSQTSYNDFCGYTEPERVDTVYPHYIFFLLHFFTKYNSTTKNQSKFATSTELTHSMFLINS
jgi:hypothetical protein